MDPEHWRDIERVFNQVLDCPAAERDALLARECDTRPSLHATVRRMLGRVDGQRDFLDEPALDVARQMFGADEHS